MVFTLRMEASISQSVMLKIAFISTMPPRKCGIAFFTNDLINNLNHGANADNVNIVIEQSFDTNNHSQSIKHIIIRNDLDTYLAVANYLSSDNFDLVCLQHEYGLFGGPAGSYILATLRSIKIPIVTTLHTLLRNPNQIQRQVLIEISKLSKRIVVISPSGIEILNQTYGVPKEKIIFIPHGIPDLSIMNDKSLKRNLALENKFVLMTHGFLSPNKGIEYVIKALPIILKHHKNIVYVVLGVTHPNLINREGELYRKKLETLSLELGVQGNIIFVNEFLNEDRLNEWINAADIYINSNIDPEQISSGTLSYAIACGKVTLSSKNIFSEDYLKDNGGILVSPRNSDEIAASIISCLNDEKRYEKLCYRVYQVGRKMIWPIVASEYSKCFEDIINETKGTSFAASDSIVEIGKTIETKNLNLGHLIRMTDDVGIVQHANYSIPDYNEGYCTDDNARALLAISLMNKSVYSNGINESNLSHKYLSFLSYAYNIKIGRMRNFMSYERKWTESIGSECCHGRTLWALGTVINKSVDMGIRDYSMRLFDLLLPAVNELSEPRAIAYSLIGMYNYLKSCYRQNLYDQIKLLSNRILELYYENSSNDWPWFENKLTYFNAVLPHSLFTSGETLKHQQMIDVALTSLEWLNDIQCSNKGFFSPVGNKGFFCRSGNMAHFDQQPIEAKSMILACLSAYNLTRDKKWLKNANRAFAWFHGYNEMCLPMYDYETGGCRDGLTSDGFNENQGAESTLSYIVSFLEIKKFNNKTDKVHYGIQR